METDPRRDSPGEWLSREYAARKQRNPRYSGRAFARLLGFSSGRVCEWLSGKRSVGPKAAVRIASSLGYTPAQTTQWMRAVGAQAERRRLSRPVRALARSAQAQTSWRTLSEEQVELVGDPMHLALLHLVDTPDFQIDPKWMAARLGVTPTEARRAWDRLSRLGLVFRDGETTRRTDAWVRTTHDVPCQAIRRCHRASLERVNRALDETPVDLRDVSSITFATHPEKIPQAKEMIRNFRRALCEYLEDAGGTEVYQLSLALVPLTRPQLPRTSRHRSSPRGAARTTDLPLATLRETR